MSKNYQKLWGLSKSIYLLQSVGGLLGWDQETYMPSGSLSFRALQKACIANLAHQQSTDVKFKQALETLIDLETGVIKEENLTHGQKIALRCWRRDFLQNTKLPSEFVSEFVETTSIAQGLWMEAKRKGDFKIFEPLLTKIVMLCRKKAELLGYALHPYDALVDLYEPGMTTQILTSLFAEIKPFLITLVQQIGRQENPCLSYFQSSFATEDQIHFAHLLLKTIGMSSHLTRLDESVHPICIAMHPTDVRFTTRITNKLTDNIFSVLHEGGHALYELGLRQEHYGTPLCESISLGVHESQSRWWEVMIGKHKSFWQYMYPKLQDCFPIFSSLSLDDFYKGVNHVTSSLIRISADEVTYPLHIILRFEIEKALIGGIIQVKDVPELWNTKMYEMLGVVPNNDREGCLQDIHWSIGSFGYFPAYALGNIYAAQFFVSFSKKFPDWECRVFKGEFDFIRKWLEEYIHQFGRSFTAQELLLNVTQQELSTQPYKKYLMQKFIKLYDIEEVN